VVQAASCWLGVGEGQGLTWFRQVPVLGGKLCGDSGGFSDRARHQGCQPEPVCRPPGPSGASRSRSRSGVRAPSGGYAMSAMLVVWTDRTRIPRAVFVRQCRGWTQTLQLRRMQRCARFESSARL
jgi:hypothetical protein